MNSKSRSGHGTLLVLVLALLMLLAVMGVAHGFFSASVVKYNQYATKGDVAIDLAENALAEAHRVIATKLNDKSCKLFQMFREKLGSFTFSLTSSDLPYLAAELKKQNCFSLVKDEVTITVLGGVSTSKAMPTDWDRAGRLRICASIVHQESKIVRRLAQIYDFRISLPAVPRPLDRHTLVIGDGIPLISTYANANETINGTQKRLDELKTVLRQRKEDFEKTKEELAGNSEAQAALPLLDLAAKECQQLLSQWPKIEGLSLFPEGAFTITTDSAQLDLSTFNLPAKVRKRASSIDVMEKQQAKSYQSLCTTLEKCANGKAEHNRVLETLMKWCQDLEGLVVEYEGLLVEDYLAFQQNCKFHEDDDMALFEAILASLVPADLIYKSTAVIYDFDVHQNGDLRNINLKFKQLINRGPAFSGVLYVMNKDEELVIT